MNSSNLTNSKCGRSSNYRLEGKTPAEACGIRIEGTNKWITLIQNASKK